VEGMRKADLMKYACSVGVETRRQGRDGKKNVWRSMVEVRAECRERQAALRERPKAASPGTSAVPAALGTDSAPVGSKGQKRARLCQPPGGSSAGVEPNRAQLPAGAAASAPSAQRRPSAASPSPPADLVACATDRAPVEHQGRKRARLCQPPVGSSGGVEADCDPAPSDAAASAPSARRTPSGAGRNRTIAAMPFTELRAADFDSMRQEDLRKAAASLGVYSRNVQDTPRLQKACKRAVQGQNSLTQYFARPDPSRGPSDSVSRGVPANTAPVSDSARETNEKQSVKLTRSQVAGKPRWMRSKDCRERDRKSELQMRLPKKASARVGCLRW